jgi:hypothetical protein
VGAILARVFEIVRAAELRERSILLYMSGGANVGFPSPPITMPDLFPLTLGLAALSLMLSDRLSVRVAGALLAVGSGMLLQAPLWIWCIVFASACVVLFLRWSIRSIMAIIATRNERRKAERQRSLPPSPFFDPVKP